MTEVFRETAQQNTSHAHPGRVSFAYIPDKIYFVSLKDLDLSVRLYNLFRRAGVSLVGQILEMDLAELELVGLGERSIDEVARRIKALGLLDPVTESNQENCFRETLQAPQETTPTTSIEDQAHFLERGYKTWGITFAAPMGWNPEVWQHAEQNRAQWSLAYRHGEFPLSPGAIITSCQERTKLSSARRERSLSPSGLAYHIGYPQEEILTWEHGTMDPGPEAIERLCRFFDEDPDGLDLRRKFYVLLSVGVNTLTVREVSEEDFPLFSKEELQTIPTVDDGSESRSHGRHDKRQRPGHGKLRDAVSTAEVTEESRFCYKVPSALLPDTLRAALPHSAHYCYVQPFTVNAANAIVAWWPGDANAQSYPDHFRVATTPTELANAPIHKVEKARMAPCTLESPDGKTLDFTDDTELRLSALAEALTNPAMPAREVRVAPAYFLAAPKDFHGKSLQQMIAPGISFPQESEQPAFETVYIQVTPITYDDATLGQLCLAYTSPFVDRFDGSRSGPVDTVWLTQAQIDQSMSWDQHFERFDSLEARKRVSDYAADHGATPPRVSPTDEAAREREQEQRLIEEKYHLVPLKNPEDPHTPDKKYEKPLELFISTQDLSDAKAQRKSKTAMLLKIIERYMDHPSVQPLGERLSRRTLEDIHYWIGEDQKKRQDLPPSVRQNPLVRSNLIMHKEYLYHERQVRNRKGKKETQNVPEVVGYRVIIGVLAITHVPDRLIVHPRQGKPTKPAPERPIKQIKWPNYVPIPERAVA